MTMTVEHHLELPDQLAASTWQLYLDAFLPLATRAAQRHVMTRGEFADVAADTRIDKFVAVADAGDVRGIGTVTNDLSAVPLISPDFYRHRYPAEYDAGKLFYVPFMATDRSPGTFRELLIACSGDARALGGLVFMDFSDDNKERGVPAVAERFLRKIDKRTYTGELDVQRYYVFGFDSADDLVEQGGHER